MRWDYLIGDAKEVLCTLPDQSVQCCVTSPPYWGLRDYGVNGQIGLEETPEAYVARLIEIFQGVRRILRNDGTLWLNLGDSYATGAGNVGDCLGGGEQGERWKGIDHHKGRRQKGVRAKLGPKVQPNRLPIPGLKPKDLVGIPWMVAFALRSDGWYLRSDIIWSKPNPMPESVRDRPTKSHEYLFLLSKSRRYYYDAEAIAEPQVEYERKRRLRERAQGLDTKYRIASEGKTGLGPQGKNGTIKNAKRKGELAVKGTRNRRTVWTITTKPYPGAHFAVFPEELITPCILAGSRKKDTILDPFAGSGTTLMVSRKLGRSAIGIDINPEYKKLAKKRIRLNIQDITDFTEEETRQ